MSNFWEVILITHDDDVTNGNVGKFVDHLNNRYGFYSKQELTLIFKNSFCSHFHASINYLDPDESIDMINGIGFDYPESLQFMYQDENAERYTLVDFE